MRLTHLSLTNFRNYARLELGLPDRLTVFQGANAQGKTNLLEAIHLLATGRSPRATAERELINWLALESTLPYARLTGEIGEGKDAQKLELVLELARNGGSAGPVVRKQVRINGAPNARWTWWDGCGSCSSCPRTSAWWRARRQSAAATSTSPCARSRPAIAAR